MIPKLSGSSFKLISVPERIKEILNNESVTVFLDVDSDSQTAQMGSSYSWDEKKNILLICVPNLESKDKPVILQILKDFFSQGEILFRETRVDSFFTSLDLYKQYAETNSDKQILNFFKDILPKSDFEALRMSLFLRDQKIKGADITTYKKDIRAAFGERGTNISNLCSAHYFEEEFMPLYNNVTEDEFMRYYELVVGKKARALFIHAHMDLTKIEELFYVMLRKAQKYHISEFRIHGIGLENVMNIKKFVSEKYNHAEEEGYIIKKVLDDPKLSAVEFTVELT